MANQQLIHKAIWTITLTLFLGIVSTAGSVIWSTNATNEQIKNNVAYSKENRTLIKQNQHAIALIHQNGATMIEHLAKISVSTQYIEKSGDDRNKLLKKVITRADKTALEQARRTRDVNAIRPAINRLIDHINTDQAHGKQ